MLGNEVARRRRIYPRDGERVAQEESPLKVAEVVGIVEQLGRLLRHFRAALDESDNVIDTERVRGRDCGAGKVADEKGLEDSLPAVVEFFKETRRGELAIVAMWACGHGGRRKNRVRERARLAAAGSAPRVVCYEVAASQTNHE